MTLGDVWNLEVQASGMSQTREMEHTEDSQRKSQKDGSPGRGPLQLAPGFPGTRFGSELQRKQG